MLVTKMGSLTGVIRWAVVTHSLLIPLAMDGYRSQPAIPETWMWHLYAFTNVPKAQPFQKSLGVASLLATAVTIS
jgi:hypothetical protein